MIKMRGKNKEDVDVVLLGLSRLNCERLLEGKPIRLNLEELGLAPLEIALVAGEDEKSIIAELRASGVSVDDVPHEEV
jgi:hypothetical protein